MERNCNTCNTEKSQTKLDCKVCHYNINNTGWSVLNWTPKPEYNVEKNCGTCDYGENRDWTKTNCYNIFGYCTTNLINWKLRRDYNQENKEQEMSYKPTSSCTLENIVSKIDSTNCDEARIEFFKYTFEIFKDGYSSNITKGTIQIDSPSWNRLILTEKRRNWLLKFGFIEAEEIKIDPWTVLRYTGNGEDVICRFVEFDGMYGLINENLRPHGKGIKFKESDFPIKISEFANTTKYYHIVK